MTEASNQLQIIYSQVRILPACFHHNGQLYIFEELSVFYFAQILVGSDYQQNGFIDLHGSTFFLSITSFSGKIEPSTSRFTCTLLF